MVDTKADWKVVLKAVLPDFQPVTEKEFNEAWERIQQNTLEEKLNTKLRFLQLKLEDRHFSKVPLSILTSETVTETSLCGFDIDGICDRLENYLSEVTSPTLSHVDQKVQNIVREAIKVGVGAKLNHYLYTVEFESLILPYLSAILQCFLHFKSENDQLLHPLHFLDGSETKHFKISEITNFLQQFESAIKTMANFGLNPFRIYAKKVIMLEIDRLVGLQAKSVYEEPLLDQILISAENLAEFTKLIHADNIISLENIRIWIKECFARCRAAELFAIINDYPDSSAAIIEMRDCMKSMSAQQRISIVLDLRDTVRTRLLHLGAETDLIITFYSAATQALNQLDPSGSMVEVVCEPIRKYVRNRPDSAEVIVRQVIAGSEEEVEIDTLSEWFPPPREAKLTENRIESRKTNLTDQLVEIFENADQFTKTYQDLLSQRLVENFKNDPGDNIVTEELMRTLDRLRDRLGDAALGQAQVMVKDCRESQKMTESCPKTMTQDTDVNVLIYSDQFWPSVVHPVEEKESDLILPKIISDQIDEIQKTFATFRPRRNLKVKKQVGMVSLSITPPGSTEPVQIDATPVQAAIIAQFSEVDEMSLEQLSKNIGLEPAIIAKRISFWISKGFLISKSDGVYRCVGEDEEVVALGEDENAETTEQLEQEKRQAELEQKCQFVWNYVRGMLSNLQKMKFERLESMLKMLGQCNPGLKIDSDTLRDILKMKQQDGGVYLDGEYYKLRKT